MGFNGGQDDPKDPLGILKKKQDDPLGILKKKESGGIGYSPTPLQLSADQRANLSSLILGKSKEEIQKNTERNKVLPKAKKYDHYNYSTAPTEKDYQESANEINDVMLREGDDWKDPVGSVNKKILNEETDLLTKLKKSNAASDLMINSLAGRQTAPPPCRVRSSLQAGAG